MKLTEQDFQDACTFIMTEICKTNYGDNFVEKGYHFDLKRMPITVRQIVDTFIEWIRIRNQEQKNNVQKEKDEK